MLSGLNVKFNVVRFTEMQDDYVGGSSLSGTVQYTDILGRLEGAPTEQILVQQGLETDRVFRVTCVPGTLNLREHDQMVLIWPPDHAYYSGSFRIVGVTYSNFVPSDPRSYLIVDLTRSVQAHKQQ